MPFRIRGLSPDRFRPLLNLDDRELAALGARRVTADAPRSAPCRVSLIDAEPGERLLLLSYEHLPSSSPFRARGPIYVREAATGAADARDRIPQAIAERTISARAYDAAAMMLEGELLPGADLPGLLDRWLARPEVDIVHLHYARRGCYAALAERA